MAIVDVEGTDYTAYTTVDEADLYLAADFARAAAWNARDLDSKGRLLVTAARKLNRMQWRPSLAWLVDGVPDLTNPALPQQVLDASMLLAADIGVSPAVADAGSTASNTNKRRVKAGSAEIEYFRGLEARLLSDHLMELLGPYLGADASTDVGAYVSGNDECSHFADIDRYSKAGGFA